MAAISKILVVENEAALTQLLKSSLGGEGHRVALSGDGDEALAIVRASPPDLLILGCAGSQFPAIELCRAARRVCGQTTPIILLARAEETDPVAALDAGADDCIVKPFSTKELLARIRALLRRTQQASADDRIQHRELLIDRAARRAWNEGREVELKPSEFRLLLFLMENPGRVFTRFQLIEALWGDATGVQQRTIDVLIGRLRRALAANPNDHGIRSVRAAGYCLE